LNVSAFLIAIIAVAVLNPARPAVGLGAPDNSKLNGIVSLDCVQGMIYQCAKKHNIAKVDREKFEQRMAGNMLAKLEPMFSASPSSGAAPLTVLFLLRPASRSYRSYFVDFGDGQAATPILESSDPLVFVARHTYTTRGTFTAIAGAQICSPSGEKCAPIVLSDTKIRVTRR
jgi:hypothetical protein